MQLKTVLELEYVFIFKRRMVHDIVTENMENFISLLCSFLHKEKCFLFPVPLSLLNLFKNSLRGWQ